MVTFEDLPCEIRSMIIEQALPDSLCIFVPVSGIERGYRRTVLRIAAISRSFSTILLRMFEVLEHHHHSKYISIGPEMRRMGYGFRTTYRAIRRENLRWRKVFVTRQSLRRVVGVLTQGVTQP